MHLKWNWLRWRWSPIMIKNILVSIFHLGTFVRNWMFFSCIFNLIELKRRAKTIWIEKNQFLYVNFFLSCIFVNCIWKKFYKKNLFFNILTQSQMNEAMRVWTCFSLCVVLLYFFDLPAAEAVPSTAAAAATTNTPSTRYTFT